MQTQANEGANPFVIGDEERPGTECSVSQRYFTGIETLLGTERQSFLLVEKILLSTEPPSFKVIVGRPTRAYLLCTYHTSHWVVEGHLRIKKLENDQEYNWFVLRRAEAEEIWKRLLTQWAYSFLVHR